VVTVNTSVATSINHPQPLKTQKRTQTSSFGKNALHSTRLALKWAGSLIPKIVLLSAPTCYDADYLR
jgi:hypothetical protein